MRVNFRRLSLVIVLTYSCTSKPTDPKSAFSVRPTIPEIGEDPLMGSSIQSCGVYREEQCSEGRQRRCEIYDTGTETFVEDPDPLLEKVYLYDRWYDLYSSPMGMTAERVFDGAMPGDTPESEWSQVSRFDRWAGAGDAGIWTGAALVSDAFRYAQTRTEADYKRMEERTRTLVRNFDVTGVEGYLSRFHFLLVPDGTPKNDQLILHEGGDERLSDSDIDMPSTSVEGLPQAYQGGVADGQGGMVPPKAYWNGDPSIDQYTGPMMAFPLVYNLIRDEALKGRMTRHLTCYLKRLQRVEVINLKARPELISEVQVAFGGGGLKLDPDDPDLTDLSRLVFYVHPGINRSNMDSYSSPCPESVQLTPSRVYDARDPTFESKLLELSSDIDRSRRNRENQIDHFYIINLRGGDASHLMHLATLAYYLTKDEQYKNFLFDELIGNVQTDAIARTMMAFRLPDWCFRFYGDHITYGTHWQFITMLEDSELRTQMIEIMEEEAWQKATFNHKSAKFNVMYASVVPDEIASSRAEAIESAISQLKDFGGNGGTKLAPRRTHNIDPQSILDVLPAGNSLRCPTQEERSACEQGGTLLGFQLEGESISKECTGAAYECVMDDGMCTQGIAEDGLPSSLRSYADFMWQRSPFKLGDQFAVDGQKQSPGRDLTEPYWMARHYGFIEEGRGQVLAWRDVGGCP